MNFHLHHETVKSFGQLREVTGALWCPCHLLAIFVEAVGQSGFVFQTLLAFYPFLDGSSTLLAGTMSLCLWLNKLACGQLHEKL